MPGRPTCLTVVGRKTRPRKLEPRAEEMALELERPAKEKKKKEKGKADRRTTSASGSGVLNRLMYSDILMRGVGVESALYLDIM